MSTSVTARPRGTLRPAREILQQMGAVVRDVLLWPRCQMVLNNTRMGGFCKLSPPFDFSAGEEL